MPEMVLPLVPVSKPVLPPLPPLNYSGVSVKDGSMCIAGATGLAATSMNVRPSTCSSRAASGNISNIGSSNSTVIDVYGSSVEVPTRRAALNGSLGFYTLGLDMPVMGNFTLTRVVAWKWDERFQAYTTEVSL